MLPHQEKIVKGLQQILADTFVLYTKTLNFHWNVVSPQFYSYHAMFQAQYEELAEAVDTIAEQIRSLNSLAIGSLGGFLALTKLVESDGNISAIGMIRELMSNHEHLQAIIVPQIKQASELGDEGTADLLIERMRFHQKTAWMLRSHLDQSR